MTVSGKASYANPTFSTLAHVVAAIYRLLLPGERRRLWLTVAVVALGALVGAGVPVLLATLLENIQRFSDASAATVLALMLAFVSTKALNRIVITLGDALYALLGETLAWRVGERLAQAVAARRVSSGARNDLGELGALQERMSKASRGVFSVLYVVVLSLLPTVIQAVFVGAVLGKAMGWHAPVLIVTGGGLYWYFVSLGRGHEARARKEVQDSFAQVARRTTELTGNARLVKEYSAQDFMMGRIQSAIEVALASNRRIVIIQLLRSTAAAAGIAACYLIAMAYAWHYMRNGTLGVGVTFLLITYVDRIISPLNSVSGYITTLRNALISMEICEELEVFSPPHEAARAGLAARDRMHDIAGGMVLAAGAVRMRSGQAALVSGPSGAGKSSFLGRVYEQAGSGKAIEHMRLDMNELTQCFAADEACYLSSQTVVLPGSVRDNILLGHAELAGGALQQVWQGVWPEVHEARFRVDLDTDVGELSAGERQRIGLARALLRRPKLLILDEATNALDLASERAIWAFVRAWLPDAVLLVAAHRVDNFADAEHEIRIRDGRIEAVA